jgi:nucleoside-diphosphate-sugar epimerase
MSDLAGKRVCIVGGAGFIGHHLALALASAGAHVHVVDGLQVNNVLSVTAGPDREFRELHLRILNQRLDLLREAEVPLHVQDARDYHALSRILSEIDPEVIVQAAAVSHAGESNKDPYTTFDHNLRTLENALDWARSERSHFVFLSSSMVYGNFLTPEVDERHPLEPIGIYGALKVAGEKIVIGYHQVFDLPYTIVRPSALYGPRCISRRVGQVFVENAITGRNLQIEGDGSDQLDFTFIDDLIHGLMLVIELPEGRNEIFNLTYGASRSIREVAEILCAQFPEIEVEQLDRDPLMPERGTLNIAKARALLGYEPQNPIEVGFPKYVEWYRSVALTSSHH